MSGSYNKQQFGPSLLLPAALKSAESRPWLSSSGMVTADATARGVAWTHKGWNGGISPDRGSTLQRPPSPMIVGHVAAAPCGDGDSQWRPRGTNDQRGSASKMSAWAQRTSMAISRRRSPGVTASEAGMWAMSIATPGVSGHLRRNPSRFRLCTKEKSNGRDGARRRETNRFCLQAHRRHLLLCRRLRLVWPATAAASEGTGVRARGTSRCVAIFFWAGPSSRGWKFFCRVNSGVVKFVTCLVLQEQNRKSNDVEAKCLHQLRTNTPSDP
jgi:hypothetical protein